MYFAFISFFLHVICVTHINERRQCTILDKFRKFGDVVLLRMSSHLQDSQAQAPAPVADQGST